MIINTFESTEERVSKKAASLVIDAMSRSITRLKAEVEHLTCALGAASIEISILQQLEIDYDKEFTRSNTRDAMHGAQTNCQGSS